VQENSGLGLIDELESGEKEVAAGKRKESCSGSYCQAVGFLVIKDDSISERPG